MLAIYIIIAIFIGWIWIDYYRLIDVYDRDDLKYFIITFVLGGLGVFVVFGIEKVPGMQYFQLNGNYLNDFLYSVFRIGAVEELAKLIPFLIAFFLFQKQLNEPIDFLVYICISALGFSTVENVLYFYNDGPSYILDRAILASVGHMFDTSLIAFGIILVRYRAAKNKVLILSGFFLLAALSHGFYDFWLLIDIPYGVLVTVFYYLITITIFATILNNALNISSFFTYKKFIDSDKVTKRLLLYYGLVFFIQFVLVSIDKSVIYAALLMKAKVFTVGFIVIVAVLRLSRFKLIKGRWEPISIELPFTFGSAGSKEYNISLASINVKGEAFNEAAINCYYQEYFYLFPVSSMNATISDFQQAYIEEKIFLEFDNAYYVSKLFLDDEKLHYEQVLLKAKTSDTTMMYDKYPIVGIYKSNETIDLNDPKLNSSLFQFEGWAYVKPMVGIRGKA